MNNLNYDSKADTLEHKVRVSQLIGEFCLEMVKRAAAHDNSKLSDQEKPYFDSETPKLKKLTYGSPEYKESLKLLGKALEHHYALNSHHPEHHNNGVDDMTLFDIIEMFFDWKSATERHEDGDIYVSIEKNKERFKISDQLTKIFENTAKSLYWEGNEERKKREFFEGREARDWNRCFEVGEHVMLNENYMTDEEKKRLKDLDLIGRIGKILSCYCDLHSSQGSVYFHDISWNNGVVTSSSIQTGLDFLFISTAILDKVEDGESKSE